MEAARVPDSELQFRLAWRPPLVPASGRFGWVEEGVRAPSQCRTERPLCPEPHMLRLLTPPYLPPSWQRGPLTGSFCVF